MWYGTRACLTTYYISGPSSKGAGITYISPESILPSTVPVAKPGGAQAGRSTFEALKVDDALAARVTRIQELGDASVAAIQGAEPGCSALGASQAKGSVSLEARRAHIQASSDKQLEASGMLDPRNVRAHFIAPRQNAG